MGTWCAGITGKLGKHSWHAKIPFLPVLMVCRRRPTQILRSRLSTSSSFSLLVRVVNRRWRVGVLHASRRRRLLALRCTSDDVDRVSSTAGLLVVSLHLLRRQVVAEDESLRRHQFPLVGRWSVGRCELRTSRASNRHIWLLVLRRTVSAVLHVVMHSLVAEMNRRSRGNRPEFVVIRRRRSLSQHVIALVLTCRRALNHYRLSAVVRQRRPESYRTLWSV